ncbi:hypothetical protein B0H11DRAFT_1002124 [Mycena galericulata]|nr:hypothetical protein B0H11DRAFT_1002124 [Mycena galericulata]
MEKVSTEALSLDSLYDDRIEDETRQILLKVQAATSEGLLGTRVLSKEDKENVPSSSGNRETQPKRRTSDLLQPILQTLPTSLVQNNQPTEEDGADLLDDTHEENEVALALAAIGDSSEDGQSEDGPAVPLQRAIQNSIVIACTKLRCSLSFGDIPHEGWDLILGHFSGRDPIETIGDAAMCVVLIEMIIERLAGVDQGVEIRKAIIGPMLSNSTFLHILCNADYFRQSSKNKIEPKFPGNAFEVLAGAVALFRSLEELKVALRPTLDPLLEASIEAWTESQK